MWALGKGFSHLAGVHWSVMNGSGRESSRLAWRWARWGGVGVVLVLLALLGVRLVQRTPATAPSATRTELVELGAELFYLDASPIVRRGSTRVVVLRLNEPVELIPHHFRAAGLQEPQPAEAWQDVLDAPVVFNAGQFDENLNHLGWLKSDGAWLSDYRKPAWKGLLVSGPKGDRGWGRVVDLKFNQPSIVEGYRHALQSMMLVDHNRDVRVRDSDLTACRTVVAEDVQGRLLIILTEGATTLADLARWLPQTPLDLVRAMNLDGGIESQLVIQTPELSAAFYGQYGTGTTVFDSSPGQMIRYPLPAVVAVRPVDHGP